MPEASGEKELVIGRIFQTIEGDEKHGALQLRGMRRQAVDRAQHVKQMIATHVAAGLFIDFGKDLNLQIAHT